MAYHDPNMAQEWSNFRLLIFAKHFRAIISIKVKLDQKWSLHNPDMAKAWSQTFDTPWVYPTQWLNYIDLENFTALPSLGVKLSQTRYRHGPSIMTLWLNNIDL